MTILNLTRVSVGKVGVAPGDVKMISSDNLSTITAAGFLNSNGNVLKNIQLTSDDVIECLYSYNAFTRSGTLAYFQPSISNGVITLNIWENPGNVLLPVVSGNVAKFNGTAGQISDSGVAVTSLVLTSVAAGQSIAASTASATPGTIRAIRGVITGSNTTMTSGNLVGARGEANVVGASGGFIYGAQGKVIATGTLSGSSWTAGVFGQLDISTATLNAGQTAALWGDYGTTSGTMTDTSGARGVSMTNTTAAVLNAQDYRYGNATYLLELAGAGGTLNYYAAAGTSAGSAGDAAHCAAQQVIKVLINGVAAYIPVFTQNT
jgi:hypothetical protein